MAAVLDTHAAIWYVLRSRRLSRTGLQFIRRAISNAKPVYISAISVIETIYLPPGQHHARLSRPTLSAAASFFSVAIAPALCPVSMAAIIERETPEDFESCS
jgi:PIN domain nuclease of toxin-antitoxin system